MYIWGNWWCEVNFAPKNAKLPPKARYCYAYNDDTKESVIYNSFSILLSVVTGFNSMYCL